MMDDVAINVTLENHSVRLSSVEAQVQQLNVISTSIQDLTLSVNKLATNMENMLAEQKEQGNRIKVLESAPADNWNSMKKLIWTGVLSAFVAAVVTKILTLL